MIMMDLFDFDLPKPQTQYVDEIYRLFGGPPMPLSPQTADPYSSIPDWSADLFSDATSLHGRERAASAMMPSSFRTYSSFSRQRLDSCGSYSSGYLSSESLFAAGNDFRSRSSTSSAFSDDGSSLSSASSTPPISPTLSSAPAMPWDFVQQQQTTGSNPWDDFAHNGIDCDLDEIDKIMRRNNLDKNVRSSTLGQGRAAELLENQDSTMAMKNRLLLLIRESEKNKLQNRRKKSGKAMCCVFCKNNGECEAVYSCHSIKDDQGRVTCPILFSYVCPKCGCSGESAHTLKYCPLSTDQYVDSKAVRNTARTAAGKRRAPLA